MVRKKRARLTSAREDTTRLHEARISPVTYRTIMITTIPRLKGSHAEDLRTAPIARKELEADSILVSRGMAGGTGLSWGVCCVSVGMRRESTAGPRGYDKSDHDGPITTLDTSSRSRSSNGAITSRLIFPPTHGNLSRTEVPSPRAQNFAGTKSPIMPTGRTQG